MSKLCETCGEEFEPIGKEKNCTECKKVIKAEYQRRYLEKKAKRENIDTDKATDKILEIISGKKEDKPDEDDVKIYVPQKDEPVKIYNVYIPEVDEDTDLYFRNVDKLFDWLKKRFIEKGSINNVEIRGIELL